MIKTAETKNFINYLKSLGITVKTNTKARGNRGFFKKGRIDISKNVEPQRVYDILAHEFAHYIHYKLEPSKFAKGGSLEKIFNCKNSEIIKKELISVTHFIDPTSKLEKLYEIKEQYKRKIKLKETQIKKICPDFQRSKPYKPFDKAIRRSKARYLLKHDRVKLITPFLKRVELYSIATAHLDFPELKPEFIDILKLKSLQKKQANNSKRINKYQKYYNSSTELFARFVQSLIFNNEKTKELAPTTYTRFFELLNKNYYMELNYLFNKM